METLKNKFNEILAKCGDIEPVQREPLVHRFFETNPDIITGPDYTNPDIVISKLKISTNYVTDFAYINPTSGPHYFNLVEIKDPTKSIFTSDDHFTNDFDRAVDQLHEAMADLQQNNDYLEQILHDIKRQFPRTESDLVVVNGHLYYGRRSEICNSVRQQRWKNRVDRERCMKIRTYDGLIERSHGTFGRDISRESNAKSYRYGSRKFNLI